MPPMLDVALQELPRSGGEDMAPREFRGGIQERHRVLQLIAKSEGAARLVERGATPEPATQRLVKQPAIQQQVRRSQGSANLEDSEHRVPVSTRCLQRSLYAFTAPVAADNRAHVFQGFRLAEQENNLSVPPGVDVHGKLKSGRGIEAGSDSILQTHSLERGRAGHRAVAPQELRAIARIGNRARTHCRERYVARVGSIP